MKLLRSLTFLIATLMGLNWHSAVEAGVDNGGQYHVPRPGGYVYYPPTGWAVPPLISPYYIRPYGYGAYYRPLPPYGFGSPYYSGYHDPNYYGYGRGTRDFLRFGGADFYGW